MGKIRIEAERVKINLCNQDAEQEFELEQPAPDIDHASYLIDPAEFRKRIEPILTKTMRQVDVAMESAAKKAGIGWDDIDAFVLVGGSSKIPYVRTMLADTYKKPIKADLNPDEIVSIGAARLAADYPPSQFHEPDENKPITIDTEAAAPEGIVDTQIKDVVSHTLGIGLKDDRYDPLIEKDKYIPNRIHRTGYTTAEDNQTSIYIPVYQGDNPKASLNYKIGEVVIDDLAPAPIGTHQFEVTFALDANGIFAGELVHSQSGSKKEIKLQRGQDALVEKRRTQLADMLDQNNVLAAPAPEGAPSGNGATAASPDDPVAALVGRAQAALNAMPAGAQAELNEALAQLILAQHGNNAQAKGEAALRIRALLDRYSTP